MKHYKYSAYDHIRPPVIGNLDRKGIWNVKPGFIYPRKDEYTNFSILTNIVEELEKRDFIVPKISVIFHLTGQGMEKFKFVNNIEFEDLDLRLWFCHKQGDVPNFEGIYNDIAAISDIHLKEISVAHREHHWEQFEYIGNDWKSDLEQFRVLQYESEKLPCRIFSKSITKENTVLINSILNQFYDYIRSFPTTNSREFTESMCETSEDFQIFKFEPYPAHYPTFYAQCGFNICEIKERFKKGFNNLLDREKIISLENERLVHLGKNIDGMNLDPIVKDGFKWCYLVLEDTKEQTKYTIGRACVAAIRPHYLDDIYVADLSISENYRAQIKNLSDAQYNMYAALRGAKFVTLKDYIENNMKFEQPQYLIRKNIGFDEVLELRKVK